MESSNILVSLLGILRLRHVLSEGFDHVLGYFRRDKVRSAGQPTYDIHLSFEIIVKIDLVEKTLVLLKLLYLLDGAFIYELSDDYLGLLEVVHQNVITRIQLLIGLGDHFLVALLITSERSRLLLDLQYLTLHQSLLVKQSLNGLIVRIDTSACRLS